MNSEATLGVAIKSRTALLLAGMMVIVPAIGATTEELLQDTLKSMLVAFFVLTASWLHLWQLRQQTLRIRLHWLLMFPAMLAVYAIGSAIWSHAYLGSVEAIRWMLFSLIVLLGMHSLTLPRVTWIAWGIHLGAVIASLWAALQFWFDFQFFAQGPNPASTFVNRNFFAEFVVCTLPFSVLLITRLEKKTSVFATTLALCFNVSALMMTGTRSALLALCMLTPLMLGTIWYFRQQIQSTGWNSLLRTCLLALSVTALLGFGSIQTSNAQLLSESPKTTAIGRAFDRTMSLTRKDEYAKRSFSMRAEMWAATGRMVTANPFLGVGAGAWEVHAPRYQLPGSQLETDYYAHNELLQLIAEYGLLGWVALIGLFSYLVWVAYRLYLGVHSTIASEALLRTLVLASLLALLVVSMAGFPWRLATTCALFGLNLSMLAASDERLRSNFSGVSMTFEWGPFWTRLTLVSLTGAAALAIYLSIQAIIFEQKIMQAIKVALHIRRAEDPHDKRWAQAKAELLTLTRDAIVINPHYRKLTPIVADSLASWGDWQNAVWIWESVWQSRPYIVAVSTNISRGYLQLGNNEKARVYLNRARHVQPKAVSVTSLEVTYLSRTGRMSEAAARARELLLADALDSELVQTSYDLGKRLHDPDLAILALKKGIQAWPSRAADGWLRLGGIYASQDVQNEEKAIESYQLALETTSKAYRNSILALIPREYLPKVKLPSP